MARKPSKISKGKRITQMLIWLVSLFILLVLVYFLAWGAMLQPKPGFQPKLSSKEKIYFKELEKREGWNEVKRYFENINDSGEVFFQDTIFLSRDYEYILTTTIEDAMTFETLPKNTEDTIAVHLYNHVIEKSSKLRRIVVNFSYVERLNERASVGHSLTAEYNVRGKRLVKISRVKE